MQLSNGLSATCRGPVVILQLSHNKNNSYAGLGDSQKITKHDKTRALGLPTHTHEKMC